MSAARLVLTTIGNGEDARALARDLVEGRFAACVSILSGVRSVYRWKGRIEDESELLLIIKTVASRVEALRDRLEAIHPYEVPEFVVIAPESVDPSYAAWLAAESVPDVTPK